MQAQKNNLDDGLNEALRLIREQKYEQARNLLIASEGCDESTLQLAYLLQSGLGGEQDYQRAKVLYASISNIKDSRPHYYLGTISMETGELRDASSNFEIAAWRGHASAAYWAGELFSGYLGHPIESAKASEFRALAVNLGHIFAIRDQKRREMASAGSLTDWVTACFGYLRAKYRGMTLAIRDPNNVLLR